MHKNKLKMEYVGYVAMHIQEQGMSQGLSRRN